MSKNALRNLMVALVGLLLILFSFLSWYKYQYSMEVIEPYEINSSSLEDKVLIATQGSPFKRQLTQELVQNLESENLYINVIDVTQLNNVDPSQWSAIIIIHTWEYFKPNKQATAFVKRASDKHKLIVVTTSGEGGETLKGIDGISSASNMSEIGDLVAVVMFRLHKILNSQ